MLKGFSYEKGQQVFPSGRVERLNANLAAIRLLKQLQNEDRDANPEEWVVLSKFTGFGAYKEVFNSVKAEMRNRSWASSDTKNWVKQYGNFYDSFRSLLTKAEWESASQSTLFSHYTGEGLSHQLWEVAGKAGFEGGLVYEPSVGTGMILGAMPWALREESEVIGVEPDPISAGLAEKLYPGARIVQAFFEESDLPDDADLVLSNVPFSEDPVPGKANPERLNLHNFMISHSLEKLRPGGLGLFITSSSTLENNGRQREVLSRQGDLLWASRLPNTALKASANTEVVTDVLLMQKPARIQIAVPQGFRGKREVELEESGWVTTWDAAAGREEIIKTTELNEYFARNPEKVLGTNSLQGSMYGRSEGGQYTVAPDGRNMEEALQEQIETVPAAYNVEGRDKSISERLDDAFESALNRFSRRKQGTYLINDAGEIRVHGTTNGLPWWAWPEEMRSARKLTFPRGWRRPKLEQEVPDLLRLRGAMKEQLDLEGRGASDAEIEANREILRNRYREVREKLGPVSELPLHRIFFQDPEANLIAGLEKQVEVKDENGHRVFDDKGEPQVEFVEMPILSHRVLNREEFRKPNNLKEAVVASFNHFNGVYPEMIAKLLDREGEEQAIEHEITSHDMAFFDPALGEYVLPAKYLSGDVLDKLHLAKEKEESDPRMTRNIAALHEIIEEPLPFDKIRAPLGAPFIPDRLYKEFLDEVLETHGTVSFVPGVEQFVVESNMGFIGEAARMVYGTDDKNGVELFQAALNGKSPRIYDKVERDGTTYSVLNQKKTRMCEMKIRQIKERWKVWLRETPERQKEIEEKFNGLQQRTVVPEYDGSGLEFPGMATGEGALVPRPKQKNAIMRYIEEQKGLLGHDVGYGKTLTLIVSAMESRRRGLARKVMIVCDNASYGGFVSAVRQLYPAADLLCSDQESMKAHNRAAFLAQVAASDCDLVMMQRSHFERIPNSDEMVESFFDEQRALMDEGIAQFGDNPKMQRQLAKEKKRLDNACRKMKENLEDLAEGTLTWDQLGIDLLMVDEVHREKKPFFWTKADRIKGIDTAASNRGTNLLLKAKEIQKRRNGKGVIGATATPISNTVAEIWNMARICDPECLDAIKVDSFDRFRAMFCEAQTEIELHEATGKWRLETRLSRFYNGPLLIKTIRSFADIANDPKEAGIKLPEVEGGGPQMVVCPLTDSGNRIFDQISKLYEDFEAMGPDDKRDYSFMPLVLMQAAVTAAADPRLIDPEAEDSEFSTTNVAVRRVLERYKSTEQDKGVQVIFADRQRPLKLDSIGGLWGDFGNAKIEVFDGEDGAESEMDAPPEEYTFNWYKDIKEKLIKGGIPADEIILGSDLKGTDDTNKAAGLLNEGAARVIIGSTDKIGTGLNFQERLVAAHHLDAPRDFSAAALTQRNGRILRSGNTSPSIEIAYYGMEDSAMSGCFHRIQRKEAMAKQALSGKGVGVEFEDLGAIDLEEMKSSLVSDKRVIRRMELKEEIKQLREAEEMHAEERGRVVREISRAERMIEHTEKHIPRYDREAEDIKSAAIEADNDEHEMYADIEIRSDRTWSLLRRLEEEEKNRKPRPKKAAKVGEDDEPPEPELSEAEKLYELQEKLAGRGITVSDGCVRLEGNRTVAEVRKFFNSEFKAVQGDLSANAKIKLGQPDGTKILWNYGYSTDSDWSRSYKLYMDGRYVEPINKEHFLVTADNGGPVRYSAANAQTILNHHSNHVRGVVEAPSTARKYLFQKQGELERLGERLEDVGRFDRSQLVELDERLAALETDLSENPAKREVREVGKQEIKIHAILFEDKRKEKTAEKVAEKDQKEDQREVEVEVVAVRAVI